MSETLFFWQGGQKVEIEQDAAAITIQADSEAQAQEAADRAGVELESTESSSPGLVRAMVAGNRDSSMERLRRDQVVHHVYHERDQPDNEILITDSFFIKFKPDTPEHRIQDFFLAEQLVVEQSLGNKTFVARVTDQTGRNPIRTANAAATREDVEYAEPNLVRQVIRFAFIPSDPEFANQWHLHAPADEAPDLVAGAGIFAPEAWERTQGHRGVVVAVADDGFDLTHPDFQGSNKVAAQLNAVIMGNTLTWNSDVSPRTGDYHGTPCLGVAVAEANGVGTVGVAPGCALVAVRFPLSMSDAHYIQMFRKVSSVADVLSCSWGVPPSNSPMSTAFRDEITVLSKTGGLRGKGLIFCVAAGNNNCPVQDPLNNKTYQYYTNTLSGRILRSYRGKIDRWIAAHPDVITVSASTSRKTRSAYSSWGRQIWVCAPSDNWDDLRQITPAGRGITTTDNEGFGTGTDFTAGSRYTNRFGGTSSATPTVAGVCALVISQNPSLSGADVKQLLAETADRDLDIISDTHVNEPGDFDVDGFSLWYGHGKVNAFHAVQAAADALNSDQTIDVKQAAALDIPDAGAPVFGRINVTDAGTINEIRIGVNITHSYIGDLRVDLIAPDGTSITLHNHTGAWANDLVRTYSAVEIAAMRPLLGKSVTGVWTLRVVDTFRLDVGRLNSWRITAKLAAPTPTPAAQRAAKSVAERSRRKVAAPSRDGEGKTAGSNA